MDLRTTQKLIGINRKMTLILAVAVVASIFLKIRILIAVFSIALVLALVMYFVLALVYWKCPHCHEYLPLKDATKLTECPKCHEHIFNEK